MYLNKCLFLLAFLLWNLAAHTQLLTNGHSEYVILTPPTPTSNEQKAIRVLDKYFLMRTGEQLKITDKKSMLPTISIGRTLDQRVSSVHTKKIKDDGFVIFFEPNYIGIIGNTDTGTLNGVYTFIQKYLAIYYLSPGITNEIIPTKNLKIPQNEVIISNPAFKWREVFSTAGYDKSYAEWHGLKYTYQEPTEWGISGHTFFKIMSPKKFFGSNPEYFSLINGRRVASQLCLSNKQVLSHFITTVKNFIQKEPNKKYWMVGQEDVGQFCQCAGCKKLYSDYGSYSGAMIYFANKIAERFPTKIIGTFAYHQTLPPPKNILPHSNVLILYAPIEAFHETSYHLATDKNFAKYLQQWTKLSDNVMFWHYVANYSNMLAPYPVLKTQKENIRFFKRNNVKYVYAEGITKKGEHLGELKSYLISKLLWNPELDSDSIVQSFCKYYYGPAEKSILEYLNILDQQCKLNGDKLRFFGGSEKYLDVKNLLLYDNLLEAAAESAGNTVYRERVDDLRLGIDFLLESHYQNSKIPPNHSFDNRLARKNRILSTAKSSGIDWIIHKGKWGRLTELIK